jgi:hypothetical protein
LLTKPLRNAKTWQKESGERAGQFKRNDLISVGVKIVCNGLGVQNARTKDLYETTVEWIAPSNEGKGRGGGDAPARIVSTVIAASFARLHGRQALVRVTV